MQSAVGDKNRQKLLETEFHCSDISILSSVMGFSSLSSMPHDIKYQSEIYSAEPFKFSFTLWLLMTMFCAILVALLEELLHEVSRRYQSTRSHDVRRAREADLVHAGRVFPVGMLPLVNPFQSWSSPPFCTSYHDQFSPSSPAGYPPQRQHLGNAQSGLQQLIGPLLPLYGYQSECSNSVMRNQFLDRQRFQLQGACVGHNLARAVYSSRGQDLPRECRAMSAPIDRVRDHNSELRPTVVVINNTPQVPIGTCAASPSQLDESVLRVSQASRSSLSNSQDFKYSQAGTELCSNNSACQYNGPNTFRDQSCTKELHDTKRTEV